VAQYWLAYLEVRYLHLLCLIGLSVSCLQVVILWTTRNLILQLVRHALKRHAEERAKEHQAAVTRDEQAPEDVPVTEKVIVHEDAPDNLEGVSQLFNPGNNAESHKKMPTDSLPRGESATSNRSSAERPNAPKRKSAAPGGSAGQASSRIYGGGIQSDGVKEEATTQLLPSARGYLYDPPSIQDHTRLYIEPYLRAKSKKKALIPENRRRSTVFTSGGAAGQKLRWTCVSLFTRPSLSS
jgi:hypothetical protein